MERGLYELKRTGSADERRILVLLTDGIIDMADRQEDVASARWLRESLLPDARQAGVRIFAIAFSEAADYELLQNMAHETDGGVPARPRAGGLDGGLPEPGAGIERPVGGAGSPRVHNVRRRAPARPTGSGTCGGA